MTAENIVIGANQETPPLWYGLTNKQWMSWKFLLIFKNGAMGALLPYMTVYLRARHLPPSQIGLIECLVPFVGAISRPIIAQIADKTHRHKLVLATCVLLYSLFTSTLYFIRPPTEPQFPVYPADLTLAVNNTFKVSSCESATTTNILSNIAMFFPVIHVSTSSRIISAGNNRRPFSMAQRCNQVGNVCKLTCKNFERLVGFASSSAKLIPISDDNAHHNAEPCQIFWGNFVGLKQDIDTNQLAKRRSDQSDWLQCDLDCYCSSNRTVIDKNVEKYVDSQSPLSPMEMFVTILVLRLVGAVFFAPVFSLEDSIIYDVLGPQYRHFWGQQKMFGNLSMGIFAFFVGVLVDYTSFDLAFLVYAVLNVVAIVIAFTWIPQPKQNSNQHRQIGVVNVNSRGALHQLCSKPFFVVAGVVALASGIFIGIVFVIWPQWVLHLGASNTLIGVTTVVGSTVESVGFFFAGFVVKRFGEVPCFLAMFLSYALRFLAYSMLDTSLVWLSLPLELFQLFCFSFFLGALTQYAATIAPEGMSATVQAILQACYFGFGLGIGILSSGAVYEKLGGVRTFQIYAAASTGCFILLLILHFAYLRHLLNKNKALDKMPDSDETNCSLIILQQAKDTAETVSAKKERNNKLLEHQNV